VKARVVSMPSWELFEGQDESYRESVLPKAVKKRVARVCGQVRGLQAMIDSDRDPLEILTQIAAVRGALDAMGAAIIQAQYAEALASIDSAEAKERADRVFAALQRFIG